MCIRDRTPARQNAIIKASRLNFKGPGNIGTSNDPKKSGNNSAQGKKEEKSEAPKPDALDEIMAEAKGGSPETPVGEEEEKKKAAPEPSQDQDQNQGTHEAGEGKKKDGEEVDDEGEDESELDSEGDSE